MAIGILFLIFGTGTAILGVTVLPVIGLVLAAPLFIIGIYFVRTHLNKKCELPE
jgi:thiol:disulfide interchange protein